MAEAGYASVPSQLHIYPHTASPRVGDAGAIGRVSAINFRAEKRLRRHDQFDAHRHTAAARAGTATARRLGGVVGYSRLRSAATPDGLRSRIGFRLPIELGTRTEVRFQMGLRAEDSRPFSSAWLRQFTMHLSPWPRGRHVLRPLPPTPARH